MNGWVNGWSKHTRVDEWVDGFAMGEQQKQTKKRGGNPHAPVCPINPNEPRALEGALTVSR